MSSPEIPLAKGSDGESDSERKLREELLRLRKERKDRQAREAELARQEALRREERERALEEQRKQQLFR